jgi:hypothetical protein
MFSKIVLYGFTKHENIKNRLINVIALANYAMELDWINITINIKVIFLKFVKTLKFLVKMVLFFKSRFKNSKILFS